MAKYAHSQTAGPLLVVLAAVGLVLAVAAALTGQVIVLVGIPVLAICGWVFSSMTIAVDERELVWFFGPGVLRHIVPTEKIAGAVPVRTSWWHGWGIHMTRHGWLYNVAGRDAVEVRLTDGARTWIGTDEPERLASVIREMIQRRGVDAASAG